MTSRRPSSPRTRRFPLQVELPRRNRTGDPSLPFVLPHTFKERAPRSSGRECPWLTVADRWRRARNGTEMARPVRTNLAQPVRRWSPARPQGEAGPGQHQPRWQAPQARGRGCSRESARFTAVRPLGEPAGLPGGRYGVVASGWLCDDAPPSRCSGGGPRCGIQVADGCVADIVVSCLS
jgi:hypothetical protein